MNRSWSTWRRIYVCLDVTVIISIHYIWLSCLFLHLSTTNHQEVWITKYSCQEYNIQNTIMYCMNYSQSGRLYLCSCVHTTKLPLALIRWTPPAAHHEIFLQRGRGGRDGKSTCHWTSLSDNRCSAQVMDRDQNRNTMRYILISMYGLTCYYWLFV